MRRLDVLVACGVVLLLCTAVRLSGQTGDYGRVVGTWVMDSTNGPDDHGLPKSEKLVITTTTRAIQSGIQIVVTEDDGRGPSTSTLDCRSARAPAPSTSGSATQCTVSTAGDSLMYQVMSFSNGDLVAAEQGRLVVLSGGRWMRDEYDAVEGGGKPATHHRHIYRKTA
jgi:hypothetical protein